MSLLSTNCSSEMTSQGELTLRREPPYWYEYKTHAKDRWYGRELVEIFTTEFRDRTKEYYSWAIHTGICNVNGVRATPRQKVKNGDLITNRVHRHEPPTTSEPIKILYRNDEEGRLVVVKPGGMPVHAGGRYFKHTLLELIKVDHNIPIVYTTNRLDRLTSGVMVCTLNKEAAQELGGLFQRGEVRKAYVCRVKGKFPEGEVVCKEPILSVDRQCGVNIVHSKGRDSETIFNVISYDELTDTSVVYCRPITGRTHQIRVHVQFLGHPIVNDPIYAHSVWDEIPPTSFPSVDIPDPEVWKKTPGGSWDPNSSVSETNHPGHSNLQEANSTESVFKVVEALKKDQDDKEDWARWKDEVLFGKLNKELGVEDIYVPGPNAKVMRPKELEEIMKDAGHDNATITQDKDGKPKLVRSRETKFQQKARESGSSEFCEECKIPLIRDPDPSELYIYLHAIKYETDQWSYEDELPWWARVDWGGRKEIRATLAKERVGEEAATKARSFQSSLPSPTAAPQTSLPSRSPAKDEKRDLTASAPAFKLVAHHGEDQDLRKESATKSQELVEEGFKSQVQLVDLPLVKEVASEGDRFFKGFDLDEMPSLGFDVIMGLEDVAQKEIHSQVLKILGSSASKEAQPWITMSALHSSFIQVHKGRASAAALQAYLSASLQSVASAYFLIGDCFLDEDNLKKLQTDRMNDGRSKTQQRRARLAEREKAKKAGLPLPSLADPEPVSLFDSERVMLSHIKHLWQNSGEGWKKVVKASLTILHDQEFRPEEKDLRYVREDLRTFKASVERSAYLFPSLTTQDLSREVADNILLDLDPLFETPEKRWSVDLKNAVFDVSLKFVRGFGLSEDQVANKASAGNAPGAMYFGLRLPPPKIRAQHRPELSYELVHGSTALLRWRAASLALALPISRLGFSAADSKPLKILEPCVGTGSFGVEIVEALRSRGVEHQLYASDLVQSYIDRAKEVFQKCGFGEVICRAVDSQKIEDLANFVGGEEQVDAIITDLPWGRRTPLEGPLQTLYTKMFDSFNMVMKPGACACLITTENKMFYRALEQHRASAVKNKWDFFLTLDPYPLSESQPLIGENQNARNQFKLSRERPKGKGIREVEIGYECFYFQLRKVNLRLAN